MPNDLFSYFSNQAVGLPTQQSPEYTKAVADLNDQLSDNLTNYQLFRESEEKANKERNFNVNSITALSLQAGKDESYASDLYNRIESVDTKEGFNSIAKELQQLKEDGKDSKYLFDFAEPVQNFVQGYAFNFNGGLTGSKDFWKTENRAKNLLKNDKLDFDTISKVSTPSELYSYASTYLNQKRGIEEAKGMDLNKLVQDINNVTNIATDKNAFNPYLSNILEDKFNTVGSEFYREADPAANRVDTFQGREFDWSKMENVEGSEAYLDSYRKALRSKVNQSPDSKDDRYFKYDLEKENIGKSKYALSLGIRDLNDKLELQEDKLSSEYLALSNQKDQYVNALTKLAKREENLQTLYGIEEGATSGGIRAFVDRLEAWAYGLSKTGTAFIPEGAKEAERQLSRRAFYTPEVVAYDKFGNSVMSSDFLIKSDNGNEYNWSGLFESGMTITGDMLPILVESALLRRGLASMGGLGAYDKFNKIKAPVIGELQLGDRLSTLTLVTANTYPKMVEEEKKWGGNYKSRAWAHALNEGLTEGIGFPDVGGLKVKGYTRTLSGSSRTAAGLELTRSQLMANYVRGGADFLKNVGKFNLLESFEEEMALLGEYLISNHIYDEEYDAVGREKTKFDQDAVMETLGESFKAGLLYSGLNAGMRHYSITRRDYMQNQSNYEAANNPELFRAQLKKEYDEGAITEKEFRDGIYRIEELKTIYENIPVLEKMANLPDFLNDEDTRFSLFTNAVRRNDLLQLDFANMTEEQRAELSAHKGASKAVQRAQEQYDAIKAELAVLTTKIENETATPEDVANHTRLTELGQVLYKTRKINVSKTDLTPELIESLRAQNLIVDEDLSFTEEDLNNIIKDIETDIIRTEQRADKYANMSREQKDEIINNLYNEKINAVKEETNPEAIAQSYSNLKSDIDEIEKLKSKKYESALRRKKELFNAYGERFEELTGKSAKQEYSRFEEELANTDIQMFLEKMDVKGLIEFLRKVEFNKNHINQDLYNILQENFNLSMADMFVKLRDSRNQNGDLSRAFEALVAMDRGAYFSLDQLNEYLKLGDNIEVNVTPEEFESLRNEYITKRGIQRSQSLAETGTYDSSDAAQSNPSTDPTEQRDALVDLSVQATQADNTTDESGNSQKKDIQKEYYDRITANKTPAEIAEILKNRVNVHFNPNSARARKLKQILNNYLANKDRSAFTDELNEIKAGIAAEIATIESSNPNSPRISALQEALAELELWEKTANKVVLKNPTTDFNTTATTEETPSPEDAVEDALEDRPPTAEEAVDQKVPDNITAGLQKLDAIMNARRARLLELTSPARTAGIEVNAENELSTDPAVVRRVKFLDKLSEQPFKAKVLNRRQFLREVLSNRFPKESDQQIEERLKATADFFETSDVKFKQLSEEEKVTFLQPITDMLGENFFDEGQIDFFLRNKGKGLVNQPDVLITVANEKGKIVYDEGGYPLELNFTAEQSAQGRKNSNWKKVPWRNSRRVEREGTELGVTEEEVLSTYGPAYDARNTLIDYLKQNDDTDVVLDADVSEGVLLPRTNYMAVQDVPGVSETASLDDFQIAQNPSESIFDKYFKFQLGRLYYNNNGNPVILNNRKISEAEAIAIAELVYSNNTDLISPAQLDAFLRTVINQIDKDNRLMFFEGERYRTVEGQEVLDQLIKPTVATIGKDGKRQFKLLTKEEFIKTLQDHYYKVDADYLLGGDKFGNKIPFISLNEAGQIEIGQESYLDYIKRTHELPVDKENKVTSMVNKSLYLDLEAIDKINKVKNIKAAATPSSKVKEKVEEQEAQVEEGIQEEKIADIERRRQEELKEYDDDGGMYDDDYGGKKNRINAKYDAELAALEGTTETKKSTTLKPKIQDKFALVPHAEFADYLGKLPPMKELDYDELIAQIEANPNSVTDVQVLIPNDQGQITGQAYERVIDNPDFELVLLSVTDKGGKTKRVLARRLTSTQAAALPDNSVVIGSVIVDKSDSREADYNLVKVAREDWKSEETVPAPKKKTPLSFEEMENSATEEALDENQKQQGKENKEACKTGSGRKAAMKSGRRSGPGL